MEDAFPAQLRRGEAVSGLWSMIGHPVVAELLADAGADFLVLDGEHSENTVADLANGIRAVEAAGTDTAALVRASGLDRAEIRRLLDFGPAGVIVPQIESADEAAEAVAATRYPPEGVRGVAGGRASGYGADLQGAVATANETTAAIPQIETHGAVDEIEEIVAIEGVDAVFVGPADLSARLGAFGAFEGEEFLAAVDRVVGAAADAGVPVGTLATGPETVERRWGWGVDFLVVGTDVGWIREGAGAALDRLAEVREAADG